MEGGHLSNDQSPTYLLYTRDDTTQIYSKPLSGFSCTNQHSMECHAQRLVHFAHVYTVKIWGAIMVAGILSYFPTVLRSDAELQNPEKSQGRYM